MFRPLFHLSIFAIIFCVLSKQIQCDWIEIPQSHHHHHQTTVSNNNNNNNNRDSALTRSNVLSSIISPVIQIHTVIKSPQLSNYPYHGISSSAHHFEVFNPGDTSTTTVNKIVQLKDFFNSTMNNDGETTIGSYLEKISDSYLDVPLRRHGLSASDSSTTTTTTVAPIIRKSDDREGVNKSDDDDDGFVTVEEEYDEPITIKALKSDKQETAKPKIFKLIPIQSSGGGAGLSLTGFIDFLKNIQNSFVTKTARSIQDKIKVLQNFKDQLLINIGVGS